MSTKQVHTFGIGLLALVWIAAGGPACDSSDEPSPGGDDTATADGTGGADGMDTMGGDTMGGMETGGDTVADLDLSTTVTTDGGSWQVSWTSAPDPIPHNAAFDVTVTVLSAVDQAAAAGVAIEVDATMPAHGHGMNVTPAIDDQGADDGVFLVQGMLFHMQGHWELVVDVIDQGSDAGETATFHIMVEN